MAQAARAFPQDGPVQATNVRQRRAPRAVDLSTTVETEPEHVTALREWVAANNEKNRAARAEKAAKAKLNRVMAQNEVKSFRTVVDNRTYEADISAGQKDTVDHHALYDRIDHEDFMRVVSATQGAVKNVCGSNVLASVIKTETTKEDLKVKEIKG